MASFTPSGVEFVARGLSGYLGDLHKADQAQQNLGKSASNIGGHFASAQSGVSSFASTVGGSSGVLSSFVSSLGQMAVVAGGNLLASGFQALASGVRDFALAGLEAVSHSQTLEASLGALLTQNNLYAQSTQTVTTAITKQLMTQDEYQFKLRELNAELKTQEATYNEQSERIRQLTIQYGENGLDVIENKAKHEELAIEMEKTRREIDGLTTSETTYGTATKTSWEQVMNMTDAQKLAKDQTADLLSFVEKLAIVSPFEQEDVEKVTQYAVGAGLGVDATKDFTAAFLDWSAAVGINSVNLDEAAYQLLQVKKAGTITAVDLRQLTTRGLDLAKVIGVEMGMSVDEFNAKAKQSPAIFDDLIQAIIRYSNNTFSGTSQAMSQSLEGFRSTLSDLFTQSAKKIFRPLVDAATPAIAETIGKITDFVTGGGASKIGEGLAKSITGTLQSLGGGGEGQFFSGLKALGFDSSTAKSITDITKSIGEFASGVTEAFSKFGARGAALNILTQLGITHEALTLFENFRTLISDIGASISSVLGPALGELSGGGIIATINAGIIFLNENFEALKGALLGIGVVIGAGILAGLAASLMTILSPITLITIGVTALFAAWSGNWFGIQEITLSVIATVTEVFNQFVAMWTANWPIIQAVALTTWEILQGIFAGFQAALGPVLTQLQTQFTQIGISLAGLGINWQTTWDAIVLATGIVAAAIGAVILGIIGLVAGLATGIAGGISASIVLFQSLATTATEVFTGLTTIFTGWITTISALFSGDFAGALEGFKTVLQGTAIFWTAIWTGMISTVQGITGVITATVGGFVEGIVSFFQGMYNSLIGNSIVPNLINGIVKLFKDLPQKIFNALGDLKSKVTAPFSDLGRIISQEVMPVVRDFTDDLLPALGKGIDFVIEGIKNFISSIKEAASALADMVVPDWLEMHSPPPLATAFNMIGAGAGNATQAIAGMQQTMLSSTASTDRFIDSLNMGGFAANSMLSNWNDVRDILHLNIGANMGRLATGELSGADIPRILGEQAGVWNVPPGMLQDIAEAQGLVDHFSETFLAFQKQIRIENLTNMTQMAGSFSSLGSSFADMLQTQMGDSKAAKSEVDKLIQSNTKLDKSNIEITDSVSDQQQKMAILQAELADLTTQEELDILAIDKKKLAIDELTEAMEKNRLKLLDNQRVLKANSLELATLATSSDAGMIEALRAFLADDSQDMFHMHKELADGTISDFFIDRNAAQIRYNELLEEQRRQEELITRQKEAQQKLDFLKSQLDLIKLGQELGGNIFQGITFGLNASVEDLLAATNAIVEAMVTQIDQDLQLGSPSRLMIGMFENVMEGAAIGVQKGASALEYAFNSSLSPFLNAGQRMLAPTGTSYNSTNNNYFNMNVSTGASASSVIRQYEVARSMI